MSDFWIRNATADDCEDIMALVKEMAKFEHLEDMVKTTAQNLREDGFGKEPYYKCLVAEVADKDQQKKLVGYALYFFIYSTFEGKSSYLEDLYVTTEYRGKGIGTTLWKSVAKEALTKGCQRMDFIVLRWNENAIRVYKRNGAVDVSQRDQWNLWRMEKDALTKFASS